MGRAIITIYIMYNKLENKLQRIGIFGLGKTGRSVFEYFKELADHLVCYDDNLSSRQSFANDYNLKFIHDLKSKEWHFLDQIIVSPGLRHDHQIFSLASKYDIPITCDIDIFYEDNKDAIFVAITGTNGKSTTSALIAHILAFNGCDFALGGNIGTPILSLPGNKKIYVLELSSFQLDLIKIFRANIVVLLNITPDHLDRYGAMENYIESKKKIFTLIDHRSLSTAIISIDHNITEDIYGYLKTSSTSSIIPISSQNEATGGVACLPGIIYDDIKKKHIAKYQQNNELRGIHNQENIAASFAACRTLGIDADKIIKAIESFKSLPHRMQYLGNIGNIHFYNDSKATNADSASMPLQALNNIFWLGGGVLKEGGIASLKPYFKNVKKAYFYGSNKQIFASQF